MKHHRNHNRQTALSTVSLLSAVLLLQPSQANDSNSALPWEPRAVGQHVDQQQFSGDLGFAELRALVSSGAHLFSARFRTEDGVGRPMATPSSLEQQASTLTPAQAATTNRWQVVPVIFQLTFLSLKAFKTPTLTTPIRSFQTNETPIICLVQVWLNCWQER